MECILIERCLGPTESKRFLAVAWSNIRWRISAIKMNKREESGLLCLSPFLLNYHLLGLSLRMMAELEVVRIFEIQDMNIGPQLYFWSNLKRIAHEILSNAFSKLILISVPFSYVFLKWLISFDAKAKLLKIILPLVNVDWEGAIRVSIMRYWIWLMEAWR